MSGRLAISRLAAFGVPDWLSQEIRHRRDGQPPTVSPCRRLSRARLTRRLMHNGIAQLGQHGSGGPATVVAGPPLRVG